MNALTTEDLRRRKPDRHTFDAVPRSPVSIVLDNLTSGFNVGSIFRLADAFLADHVYLCGTTPGPPKARIAKTSMGTERWTPWEWRSSALEVTRSLQEQGRQIVAIELTGHSLPPEVAPWRPPVALVVGDEMLGVNPEVLRLADMAVAVPMSGMGNSLNVATALAIVAYELARVLRDGTAHPIVELRALRKSRRWSMRELAARSGVHYTSISNLENGRHQPTPDTMRRLMDALVRDGVQRTIPLTPSSPRTSPR